MYLHDTGSRFDPERSCSGFFILPLLILHLSAQCLHDSGTKVKSFQRKFAPSFFSVLLRGLYLVGFFRVQVCLGTFSRFSFGIELDSVSCKHTFYSRLHTKQRAGFVNSSSIHNKILQFYRSQIIKLFFALFQRCCISLPLVKKGG